MDKDLEEKIVDILKDSDEEFKSHMMITEHRRIMNYNSKNYRITIQYKTDYRARERQYGMEKL